MGFTFCANRKASFAKGDSDRTYPATNLENTKMSVFNVNNIFHHSNFVVAEIIVSDSVRGSAENSSSS